MRVLRWKSRGRYREALQAVADAAGVGRQLRPKDMRDTYACQLLTQGIPLAYIAGQLGHEQVTTTARHYASWIDQDGYRNPPPVADDEVPADLPREARHHRVTPCHQARESEALTDGYRESP